MNSINIFEKLNFIDVLFLVLRRNHHIYFIKSNFTSKFFSFFGVKKIKKLEWNLIDLENYQSNQDPLGELHLTRRKKGNNCCSQGKETKSKTVETLR